MKYKVSEIEGALLDAAVAKAAGLEYSREQHFEWDAVTLRFGIEFAPSTEWCDGGPIIEREKMDIGYCYVGESGCDELVGQWYAQRDNDCHEIGATPLIAAMRAYVASKFGEEVEL